MAACCPFLVFLFMELLLIQSELKNPWPASFDSSLPIYAWYMTKLLLFMQTSMEMTVMVGLSSMIVTMSGLDLCTDNALAGNRMFFFTFNNML